MRPGRRPSARGKDLLSSRSGEGETAQDITSTSPGVRDDEAQRSDPQAQAKGEPPAVHGRLLKVQSQAGQRAARLGRESGPHKEGRGLHGQGTPRHGKHRRHAGLQDGIAADDKHRKRQGIATEDSRKPRHGKHRRRPGLQDGIAADDRHRKRRGIATQDSRTPRHGKRRRRPGLQDGIAADDRHRKRQGIATEDSRKHHHGKHRRRHGLHRRHRKGPPGERFVLVGNPNVGKSVIFGLLTGRYVVVSNYPGTTVEVSRGDAKFVKDGDCEILDTPGVNSLLPMSEDEIVARDILLTSDVSGVVQVVDAKNLRRGLLLSLQLAEMGLPFVVALNMSDEARSRGIRIDERALSKALGVDVIPTVATQRRGISRLTKLIPKTRHSRAHVRYRPEIEGALKELEPLIPQNHGSGRSIALMLLAGDESLAGWVRTHLSAHAIEQVEAVRRKVRGFFPESVAYVITEDRYKEADLLAERVLKRKPPSRSAAVRGTIERATTHPVWGLFFMAAVLVAVFAFVAYLGAQVLVDLMETRIFGGLISPGAIRVFDAVLPFPHQHLKDAGALGTQGGALLPSYELLTQDLSTAQRVAKFIHDIMVGPYGVVTMAITYSVAIVLPIVGTFFIAFGFLEDSGYLPRLAVMSNRVFKVLGLNGKAVLPMVLGLGCDTMATLTARILDTRKERLIVTLLLALGVPCSAQLGVIIGMLASISIAASLIWVSVIVGVMFLVGFLAARIFRGESSDFILELPPLRMPRPDNIAVKTLARVEWYLKEAVPLFILGTLVLFAMDALALLATVERAVAPVVQGFLNLPGETTEAFIAGFLRRDYGAAGLYSLSKTGAMDSIQILVSLVVITLFVPCIANFFVIIKERGLKAALGVVAFVFPFAFLVGGVLNFVLRTLKVNL